MMVNDVTTVSAVAFLALLSNCSTFGPNWTTLESNLGNSIVEQRLSEHEIFSGSAKERFSSFQKTVIEDLERAGHLRSDDSLREYLMSSGMDCSSLSSSKQMCRFFRYRIERLLSGDPADGATRVDWNVVVSWNKSDSPVRPSLTMDRTARIVNAAR